MENNNSTATGQLRVVIKNYRLGELADMYGVSDRVMRRRIKALEPLIGERDGWYYSARQVKIIFRELGVPGVYAEDD
jgi:hypothetical protein